MDATAAEWRPGGSPDLEDASSRPEKFQHFCSFDDDLATLTLSFISDLPFEIDETNFRSSLTHIIPLVSKRFHELVSRSDILWRDGLARLVMKEPYVWREGVMKLISSADEQRSSGSNIGNSRERTYVGTTHNGDRVFAVTERESFSDEEEVSPSAAAAAAPAGPTTPTAPESSSIDSLIDDGCKSLSVDGIASNCQRLFREVVSQYVRFNGPVFYMPGNIRIGEEFGLHFFEPRYRLLISEVMAPFPLNFRRGDPIQLQGSRMREFPKFVYANHSPLQPGAPACIVEVRQCLINPNGTADVFLCPTSYIWIEQLWERPNSGALYEARGIRMTSSSSRALERQATEAEARRMAAQAHMFPTGDHADIMQALLQHLAAQGAGHDDDDDDEEEEDEDNIIVVD